MPASPALGGRNYSQQEGQERKEEKRGNHFDVHILPPGPLINDLSMRVPHKICVEVIFSKSIDGLQGACPVTSGG